MRVFDAALIKKIIFLAKKQPPHTHMFFGKKYVFLLSAAPNMARK